MLELARDLGEIKSIIDIAEAARVYIRAAKIGQAAERHAEEIKLRAQRKAGDYLAKLEKGKPGRPGNTRKVGGYSSEYRKAIEETGISERSAERLQQVASIPAPRFREYIIDKVRSAEEVSTNGLLEQAKRQAKEEHREKKRDENATLVQGVRQPDRGGRYGTIVLDPPSGIGATKETRISFKACTCCAEFLRISPHHLRGRNWSHGGAMVSADGTVPTEKSATPMKNLAPETAMK